MAEIERPRPKKKEPQPISPVQRAPEPEVVAPGHVEERISVPPIEKQEPVVSAPSESSNNVIPSEPEPAAPLDLSNLKLKSDPNMIDRAATLPARFEGLGIQERAPQSSIYPSMMFESAVSSAPPSHSSIQSAPAVAKQEDSDDGLLAGFSVLAASTELWDDPEALVLTPPPRLQVVPIADASLFTDLTAIYPNASISIRSYSTELDRVARGNFFGGNNQDPNNAAQWSEFYRLLRSYLERQLLLEANERDLSTLKSRLKKKTRSVWTVREETVQLDPKPCGDNNPVQVDPIKFNRAVFNQAKYEKIGSTLAQIRAKLFGHLTVLRFEADTARARVETALDATLFWSTVFGKITTADPVVALSDDPDVNGIKPIDLMQMESARNMLNSLFSFIRSKQELTREFAIAPFWQLVQTAISRIAAVLLRCGTMADHRLLLNHLVHASRTDEWSAASMIQFPEYGPAAVVESGEFDHFCQMLQLLLSPVAKSTVLPVDSPSVRSLPAGAESGAGAGNSPFIATEDDIVAILKQFPFDEFIDLALLTSNAAGNLSPQRVKLGFSFCEQIITTMLSSISVFQDFRHLSRRIAELSIQVLRSMFVFLEHVSDPGLNSPLLMIPGVLEELKTRADRTALFVFEKLYLEQSLWQFLVHLPYDSLHRSTIRSIFASIFIEKASQTTLAQLEAKSLVEWHKYPVRERLMEKIKALGPESAEFILLVLSCMARTHAVATSGNISLICFKEIFEIAYVLPETREILYKPGRDVVCHVASSNPIFISHLIKWIHTQFDQIGSAALYLFQNISLDSYAPTQADLRAIDSWLITPSDSNKCKLAQLIIENLSWENYALLHPAVHRAVALMITGGHLAHERSARARTATSLLGVLAQQRPAPGDSKYDAFCIATLWRLRHFSLDGTPEIPLLSAQDPLMKPLFDRLPPEKALLEGPVAVDPIVAFAALQVSELSGASNPAFFLRTTIPLLRSLAKLPKNREIVFRLIRDTIPSLLQCPDALAHGLPLPLTSHGISLIRDIILPLATGSVDGALRLSKKATDLLHTKVLLGCIAVQLQTALSSQRFDLARQLIQYWCAEIFSVEDWWHDQRLTFLVDNLIFLAFSVRAEPVALQLLATCEKTSASTSKIATGQSMSDTLLGPYAPPISGGLLSLLFGPSEVPVASLTRPWLVLALCVNTFRDEKSGWSSAGRSIVCSSNPVSTIKDLMESNSRWVIRALSSSALVAEPESASCIRLWQLFFALYFTRAADVVPPTKLFFSNAFLKQVFPPARNGATRIDKMRERLSYLSDYSKTKNRGALSDMFRCMAGWLTVDLDRFTASAMVVIDANLQPQLISTLMEFSGETQELWSQFDDPNSVRREIDAIIAPWNEFVTQQLDLNEEKKPLAASQMNLLHPIRPLHHGEGKHPQQAKPSRAARRKNAAEAAGGPGAAEVDLKPPEVVNQPPQNQPWPIADNPKLFDALMSDLNALEAATVGFNNYLQSAANVLHLLMENIPNTHSNIRQPIRKLQPCARRGEACMRPAEFLVMIEVGQNNPKITALVEAYITELDNMFVMNEHLVPVEACFAALRLEKTLTNLCQLASNQSDPTVVAPLAEMANRIFFALIQRHMAIASKYPPARICIDSQVRLLGPTFIAPNASAMKPLLHAIISGDDRAQLLTPYFNPKLAPNEFVAMYKLLSDSVGSVDEKSLAEVMKRFDVSSWLRESNAKKEEQQDLFRILTTILLLPSAQVRVAAAANDLPPAWAEALNHVSVVVSWQFPLHLNLLLQFVFDSLRKKTLAAHIWEVLLQLPLSTNLKATAVLQILKWMTEYIKTFAMNRKGQLLQTWGAHASQFTRLICALSSAACRQNASGSAAAPLTASIGSSLPALQSASDAASAALAAVLNLISIFVFPVPEYGIDWSQQADLYGFAFIQALVDCLNNVFLKSIPNQSLDQVWRWWINSSTSTPRPISMAQQSLFEIQGFTELPWHEASLSTADIIRDLSHLMQFYASQQPQPILASAVGVFCAVITARAGSIVEIGDLKATFEFVTMVISSMPWPIGLPLERLLRDVIPAMSWEHLPVIAIASSPHIPKYILEYFNNQNERGFIQFLAAEQLNTLSPMISIPIANVHEQMALRLITAIRFLRLALCWPSIAAQLPAKDILERIDHYNLYVDLIMELCPRSFLPTFAAEVSADIFRNIGSMAALLLSAYPEGEFPEQNRMVTEHLMRMTARMVSVVNIDFNPALVDAIHTVTITFVQDHPTLALLVLRSASVSIISEKKQPPLLEECLETDLLAYGDWNRATLALAVPELGRDSFIDRCLEIGAIITLYTHSLQVLNSQQENDIIHLLNFMLVWVNKLKAPPHKEWKLLLLWIKTTQLLFWILSRDQLQMDASRLAQLENLANFIFEESKSRKGGGIWGMIGLGERSSYPPEFRLTTRLLALFIMSQFPAPVGNAKRLRRFNFEPLEISPTCQQHLKTLLSTKAQEEFKEFEFLIQNANSFICNPQKTLADLDDFVLLVMSGKLDFPILLEVRSITHDRISNNDIQDNPPQHVESRKLRYIYLDLNEIDVFFLEKFEDPSWRVATEGVDCDFAFATGLLFVSRIPENISKEDMTNISKPRTLIKTFCFSVLLEIGQLEPWRESPPQILPNKHFAG